MGINIRILIFVCIIGIAFCISLHASQQDTPLTATVNVKSVFNISLHSTVLDFGTIEPGNTSLKKAISFSCTTNNNNPWAVSIYAQSPLTHDQYEIPISNFKWEAAIASGTGNVTPHGDMSLSPTNFYIAGMDDYITETPVELLLSLYVDIPPGQVAGLYSTIVVITMYEE